MPHTPIDSLNFSHCSLFSSQEYSIESGNLHVTNLSLGKSHKEIIPLDLIESKPKISKKNDKQLVWASIISFVIGVLFLILTANIEVPIQHILGFIFIGISFIFLIASLKLQTTSYTYFYANSSTKLFTIYDTHSKDADNELEETQNAKKFIESLNKRITKPKATTTSHKTNKANYKEFLVHLDYLYNHGVIADIQYDRMIQKVQEIVYGIKRKKISDNVIPLPLNNL